MSDFSINRGNSDPEKPDRFRIKGNEIRFTLNSIMGKQDDFLIIYIPSLNISGYGKTRDEAEELIQAEIKVFCEDVMKMSTKERNAYLSSIGFKASKFQTKNYAKSYVDVDGKLQDFDEGTVEYGVLKIAV